MGPDSPGGDTTSKPPDEPLIFMSDASAEAERLTSALRNRGYTVVEVPLTLLVGRVSVQKPAMILCDVDATGALDQVKRLRDVPGGNQVDIVFFGEAGRTLDELRDEVFHEASGFFVRPVDTFGLLRKVEALIGPPSTPGPMPRMSSGPSSRPAPALSRPASSDAPPSPSREPSDPGGREVVPVVPSSPSLSAPSSTPPRGPTPRPTIGPSSLPPSRSSAPPMRTSSAPPEPSLPAPIPLGFAPEQETTGNLGRQMPQTELSPELESILARAEQRVGGGSASARAPGSLRMTPEAEVEAVLPLDVLAALDEPLDIEDELDDDADGTGTGRGTTGSARTGLGTGVGTTGGGLVTGVATGSGVLSSSVIVPNIITSGVPTDVPGAAGPTAPPPRRPDAETRAAAEADDDDASKTPPAIPTRPPEPPSWPPVAGSLMTAVEPKPMSVASPGDALTAVIKPTPLPPAPTPEGIRLPRPTAPNLTPATALPMSAQAIAPPPMTTRAAPATPEIPSALGRGDAALAVARVVRSRFTGAVAFESDQGIRRVVFRDGDFVTAASSVSSETLVAFLNQRGTVGPEVLRTLGHKLPPFGRHAGAALIAHGHLRQDELWPVLRAHAEWLVGRVITMQGGAASIEKEVPARLQAEPAVFGGATGAEVFVEIVRREVDASEAVTRLGGPRARVVEGEGAALASECALGEAELALVNRAKSSTLAETLQSADKPDFAALLYALLLLGVVELEAAPPVSASAAGEPRWDHYDEQALRARILARKALVEEGDYFALLGIGKGATSYDVQRAYSELRHEFEPSRILTASTADLRADVDVILEVLDEAYEILKDQLRRERYRRALEAAP